MHQVSHRTSIEFFIPNGLLTPRLAALVQYDGIVPRAWGLYHIPCADHELPLGRLSPLMGFTTDAMTQACKLIVIQKWHGFPRGRFRARSNRLLL